MPDAPDEGRAAPRLPRQPEKIHAGFARDAAPVFRFSVFVKRAHIQPAVFHAETGRPDDRADSGLRRIQRKFRRGHARRVRFHHACFRLFGKIQTVARDERVGFVQQRKIIRVAARDVGGEVRRKMQRAAVKRLRAPEQRHARGEAAKIHGAPAVRAADRDGHMLGARLRFGVVPFAEHAEPPNKIAPAVAAKRPVVPADREIDAPPGARQFVGDLHSRGAGADHQRRALRQLPGVAVFAGMDLQDSAVGRNHARNVRRLKRAGRGDHAAGLNHALRGFHAKAAPARNFLRLHRLHAAAHRRVDLFRIRGEIVGDIFLRRKRVGIAGKFPARKAVVPGRPVCDQRIPSPAAPTLGDARALQHQMRNAAAAQMLAHRDSGLPAADNQRFNFFRAHFWRRDGGKISAARVV